MRQVGERLGRYTLLKRLAVGGMGEVFVAAKPGPVGFGPYVALKILRDELAGDQQFVDMLVDEANISMFLNHQNVVSVLDLSEDNGAYYIAMEYVQGITVERLVDSLVSDGKKLEIPHALYIAVELCRALKYAHTRVNHEGEPLNIVHRDVTPANILLSVQGEVKLTDFGIARARGRIHQTQAGVLKGKFGYMAPEMVRYERIDARADLFCAGVVMYLMLSGRHPVAGAAVMEAIQRFEQKRIPPPSHFNPDIPTALDTIVMRALEPQPEQRWGSAAALGDALQDVMLQNPEWRKFAKDGGQRLVQVLRQVAANEFVAPVHPDTLAELLSAASADEPEVISPAFEAEPDVATDGRLPAIDDKPPGLAADLETDDQLDVERIMAAQQELHRQRGASAVADLLQEAEMSAPTASTPLVDQGLVVQFPETSTDRDRQQADLLVEPALPADTDRPQLAELPEDTEAAYTYQEGIIEEGVIRHPVRPDTDRDERTVVNPPSDDFDGLDLETDSPLVDTKREERAHDNATVPEYPDSGSNGRVDPTSDVALPRILDSLPEGPPSVADEDDPSTVIPLFGTGGETDQQTPMSADEPENFADATLLDGIDSDDVRRAIALKRLDSPASLELTLAAEGSPGLDAVTVEAEPDQARARVLKRMLSKVDRADARTVDGPPMLVSGSSQAPQHDVAVGQMVDGAPGSGAVTSAAEPAANAQVQPVDQRPVPEVALNGPLGPFTATEEPTAGRPVVDRAAVATPGVGTNTGRWMAGEIDANALSWDDEAAARRAVATRDKAPGANYAGPTRPTAATNTGVDAHGRYSAPSFWERNSMLLATMVVAFGLLAGLIYAIMFTQVFWPRLKLSSEPSGAGRLGRRGAGARPNTARGSGRAGASASHRVSARWLSAHPYARSPRASAERRRTPSPLQDGPQVPPKVLLAGDEGKC